MLPQNIIACVLVFFFLEFVQLKQIEAVATSTIPVEASPCLMATFLF